MEHLDFLEIEGKKEAPKKVYVAFVVDESSSMNHIKAQAISLFNENLATLKIEGPKNNIEYFVTFVKFASSVNVLFENRPVDSIEDINDQSYSPKGMTAMYDGIKRSIDSFKSISDFNSKNVSFLLIIITDGEENSSSISSAVLSEEIKKLEDNGRWTFTVLGANIDLKKLTANLNISKNNVSSFAYSPEGVNAGSNRMRNALVSYGASVSGSSLRSRVDDFYASGDDLAPQENNVFVGLPSSDDPLDKLNNIINIMNAIPPSIDIPPSIVPSNTTKSTS